MIIVSSKKTYDLIVFHRKNDEKFLFIIKFIREKIIMIHINFP